MPSDQQVVLTLGRRGINLRDHPVLVHRFELVDSVNWQIGVENAMMKRLGYQAFGVATLADILELAVFQPAGGTPLLIAYCANGKVYKTDDGDPWTEIATGLSTTARPTFVQYLDKLYWANGVDNLRSYDGTTVVDISSAPDGEFLAVWRNRLWIAQKNARKVWWSKAGDPADWTNTFNNVVFPNWPAITGMTTAPNIGTESEAGDGVLVFTSRSTHRIVDDSDNASGVAIGGSNVLVDASHGCIANRTIAHVRKRVYLLGVDGIYSTDGHDQLRVESAKLTPLFVAPQLAYGSAANMIGLDWNGRYLFAFTEVGGTDNATMLELYLDLGADEDGQFPWMAHDVPAASWVRFPASSGDILYFADSRTGDERRVRRLFAGGSDVSGAATLNDIRAYGRSGGMNFDIEQPKLVRRIYGHGHGALTVTVIPDFDTGHSESALLDLRSSEGDALWDGGQWDGGVWDVSSGHHGMPAYMNVRGRYIAFEIVEVGSETTASDPRLGLGTVVVGGAALHALQVTHAPLDSP